MVNLTIDNIPVTVPEGTTILDAARLVGIKIPTLCYLKDINEIGACRVCVVEVEGNSKLSASCNTIVDEGMVVHTNSIRVRAARKNNVELILSQHNTNCTACVRSQNCVLQTIANDLKIIDVPFDVKFEKNNWNPDSVLIRDASKCVKCMRCVNVCEKVQAIGAWDVAGTGTHTTVKVTGGKTINTANCTLCGQCITHCPVGALRERDDTDKFFDAITDADKICIVQVAPAVRTAWGEDIGLTREEATVEKMISSIRALGVDYVFDTNFSADVTIMEESNEFIERFTHRDEYKFPMFTSCCPGWARFVKLKHPELIPNLSTAKSPQQIFGAIAKTYFAEKIGVAPENIFCVSIMPCLAKKYECDVDEINASPEYKDVDLVITTRELARMLKANHVNALSLPDGQFDSPLGMSSGAGVIFGTTGGVMEAALRTAHAVITGEELPADAFSFVRGEEGWREASIEINGKPVRIAVAHGLGNTERLIEAIENGEKDYDFVEIMACPSGCVGGGGQPIREGCELGTERAKTLYRLDKTSVHRKSHENPEVITLYNEFLGSPLSHKSHDLLHTDLSTWTV